MHQLKTNSDNRVTEWSREEQTANKERQHTEMLLELLPEEEWISMRELYPEYKEKVEDPVHRVTLSTYLRELRSLGYVEMKGRKGGSKYRRADKPIQETRNNYMSPLSEGTPVWLNRRIKEVVEDRLETMIQRMVEDQLEEEVKETVESHMGQVETELSEELAQSLEKVRPELGAGIRKAINKEEFEDMKKDKVHLLKILMNGDDSMGASEIYSKYKQDFLGDKSKRTVRRYLEELAEEALIVSTGQKSGRKYKAVA